MHPELIELGPFLITSVNFMMAIGMFSAIYIVGKLAQKNRLRLQFLINILPSLVIAAIISGRFFAVLDNYQFYFNQINLHTILKVFAFWEESSFWGAIFGLSFVFIKNCQSKGENLRKWADVLMIGLITVLTFRNIGNFLDGSKHGIPTDSFLGVTFNTQNIIYTGPIHPTQLYATAYTLIIAFFLH